MVGRVPEEAEVAGDHEDREPQQLVQVPDQFLERPRALGIEPRARLVEERGAPGRARWPAPGRRACACRPRAAMGTWDPALGGRPTSAIFRAARLVQEPPPEPGALAQRECDVLGDGERAEQRGALEHHAAAPPQRERLLVAEPYHLSTEDLDRARVWLLQRQCLPQQHAFPAAARPRQREDLSRGGPPASRRPGSRRRRARVWRSRTAMTISDDGPRSLGHGSDPHDSREDVRRTHRRRSPGTSTGRPPRSFAVRRCPRRRRRAGPGSSRRWPRWTPNTGALARPTGSPRDGSTRARRPRNSPGSIASSE